MSASEDLLSFLSSHGISYTKYDHPPVFTCEQAVTLNLKFPGMDTKNLFLAEKGGMRRFLVVVPHHKRVALKQLAPLVQVKRFDFGGEDDLLTLLGVTPGSVTLMGLSIDREKRVEVIVDTAIWDAPVILCHPMENTSTIALSKEHLIRFLEVTGHRPSVIEVPEVR